MYDILPHLQGAVSVSHPNTGQINRVFINHNTEGDSQLIIPVKKAHRNKDQKSNHY